MKNLLDLNFKLRAVSSNDRNGANVLMGMTTQILSQSQVNFLQLAITGLSEQLLVNFVDHSKP
jgi:hypothetical protein